MIPLPPTAILRPIHISCLLGTAADVCHDALTEDHYMYTRCRVSVRRPAAYERVGSNNGKLLLCRSRLFTSTIAQIGRNTAL